MSLRISLSPKDDPPQNRDSPFFSTAFNLIVWMDYVYTNQTQSTGGGSSDNTTTPPPSVYIPNAGYPPNIATPPGADPATQQQYLYQQQLIMQQQQHLAQQKQQQQNQQQNAQRAAGQPEAHYQRSTEGLPRSAIDRAASAKLRLENFYKGTLAQTIERNQR
jgi:hypothetical protein